MIEIDLVAHLKSDVTLTALIGTRIYPLTAPQNVVKPYATYRVIGNKGNQCLQGGVYQKDKRFQIDCWSLTYSNVKAIEEAVIKRLEGFKGFNSLFTMDDYEPDTLLYRQLIDFKLKG